jgi:DNA polymerase III subunit gamma/tau
MAYVSLYRKWRPQTFADVVGQDHVVGTLVNAIQTGQVHHAMLFSGTRGTGKTTTARILAKALNCVHGPTPEPCNACEPCRSITDGTNLDVVEIDAASHGSVDDARDLREKASYAPAAARFKVYIVDEAHMVTPQGFNAMLKVLEEPPDHVRFVFCTTEPHKVIEAIRSRCQQHDFRRIPTAVLAADFAKICAAEGVDIEPAALELVGRTADGSHRDGLSRLDQVLTYAGASRQVRLADVAAVLGALPTELRFDLAEALAGHRVGDVFGCVQRVVEAGHDLHQFAREALEHLRDLLVLRVAPESAVLVDVTPETRERLVTQAERFGPGELGRLLRVLGDVYLDLRTATDQRLVLEVGLARAALPEASLDADALLSRIERLERRLAIGGTDPAVGPVAVPAAPAVADEDRPAASAPARPTAEEPGPPAATADPADWGPAETAPAAPVDLDLVRRSWPLVVERVQASSRLTASFLGHGRPVALEGAHVVVEFPRDKPFEAEALGKNDRHRQVNAVLEGVLGGGLEIRVVVGDAASAVAEPEPPPEPEPVQAPAPVTEFEVDPEHDEGRPLDVDADVRTVADWAAQQLGGQVIEERPNEAPNRRGTGGARAKGRSGGRRSGS